MNSNARLMLEALTHSTNGVTQDSAKAILEDRDYPNGRKAEELATTGILGDFIKAVMTGDFLAAYGAADLYNQRALRSILAPDNDRF